MKLLLIAANRVNDPFPVPPIGVLTVAAAARAAGHEVEVADMMFARSPAQAVAKAIASFAPDAVGIGIRNLDNVFFISPQSYFPHVDEVAQAVRRHSDGPLILGGSGFTVAPLGWMARIDADFGVVGEGECALVALLAALEGGGDMGPIPGVLRRGDTALPPASQPPDLRAGSEAAHDRIAYRRYLGQGGYVSIQTKRGCVCDCIYCVYPQLEGRRFRLRDPLAVVDEMARVAQRYPGCAFYFTDSVFNMPRDHAMAVCGELVARKVPGKLMAYVNPVDFDDDFAQALVAAGFVGIEFGLDAAEAKMLGRMGKPFDQTEIRTAFAAAKKADLPFGVHLLFGGPGETLADIQETQDFLASCATPNIVFASLGIRVYDRTPIRDIALREGVLAPERDLFDPWFYVSPALGKDPMAAMDRIACQRPEWSTPVDWESLTLKLVQKAVKRFNVHPLWRDAANYGRYMRRPRK